MNAAWMVPFIILGGALQSFGAAMNGQLNKSLVNPYLAAAVSFLVITFFFLALFFRHASPFANIAESTGNALVGSLGGLVGAVQVFAGLTLVHRIGTGNFVAITVTAALIASLAIDHFGWFRMEIHSATPVRVIGTLLLVIGVFLMTKK